MASPTAPLEEALAQMEDVGSTASGGDTPIEADSYKGGGSDASSSLSVTSNVWRFEKENGRTYHGYRPGVYYYPNDSTEAERLDYQHCVIDFALEGVLHFAPLSSPLNVLDIGTGTGAWAIEMGDAYPDAIVEGTDLSPIQPTDVPTNVRFVIDDLEQEDWAVPLDHYDYIHTRFMMGCFEDFRAVINRGFRHTKPGGWMESQDLMHPPFCDDGTMPEDWPFKDWSDSMEEASLKANRPLRIANKLKRWYTEAGFVDVHEKIIKLPINSWPRDKQLKTLGKYWAEDLLAGLQGFSLALFSREFGWSKTEIEVYLVNVRKSITDHRVHAYHKYYVVYGRKPSEPSHEPSLSDLTITAPTPVAVESVSDAHPEAHPDAHPDAHLEAHLEAHLDAINVPLPPASLGELETSPDLTSDSQNYDKAGESQGPVESSSKAALDATTMEVSPDLLPLTPSLPQEAKSI